MTLLYFEGFDIHRAVTGVGGLIVGDPDTWYNWQTGTLPTWRPSYIEGYQTGQALVTQELMYSSWETLQLSINGSRPAVRMGWWGSQIRRSEPLLAEVPFLFWYNRSETIHPQNTGIWAHDDGSLQLFDDGVFIGAATAPILTDDPTDWHYWEAYFNSVTGEIQLSRDEVVILSGNTVTSPVPEIKKVYWNGYTGALPFPEWQLIVDHLWITDGDELDFDQEVLGVSIDAAQDSYTTSGSHGFRGTLSIGDQRYQTEWSRSAGSSTDTHGGRNVCTVTPFFWMNNPVTDTPWTDDTYEDIRAWGVCFAPTDEVPGNEARLDALVLSKLVPNNGRPLVVYELPGSITEFSGDWRKTNDLLTYAGHVQDVPRDNIPMAVDSLSLYTDTLGCILFNRFNPGGPDPEDLPLTTIGITFAEEFREDYTDFKRVDGEGTDYSSYAVAGYSLAGDSHRRFTSNYVTVNYEVIENAAALVRAVWDYSLLNTTGEWSMAQQVYRLDASGHKHAAARLKFRGNGRAFQLRLESQPGKGFAINGWAVFITVNQNL